MKCHRKPKINWTGTTIAIHVADFARFKEFHNFLANNLLTIYGVTYLIQFSLFLMTALNKLGPEPWEKRNLNLD